MPGDELVENHSKRENIRAAIDGVAFDLLGRHVRRRADHRSRLRGAHLQYFRRAEIGDLQLIVLSEHQVGGLDVAVDHQSLVREFESGAGLLHQAQHARQRKRLPLIEQRLEAAAFDQLHGDVKLAIFFAGVEDHHDVGVRQEARGASFSLKARHEFLARQAGSCFDQANGLHGDVAADDRILRAVDDAHGAAAELVEKLVASGFG